jgi:4-deoxy-L-threo-5-hexosulose-uronate ketol-isomerase
MRNRTQRTRTSQSDFASTEIFLPSLQSISFFRLTVDAPLALRQGYVGCAANARRLSSDDSWSSGLVNASSAIRIHASPRPADVRGMNTDELRHSFLIENVIVENAVSMHFTDLDRLAIGGVKPTSGAIELPKRPETGTEFFLERRELGVLNIGGRGTVRVDGKEYPVDRLDSLYVAMGSRTVAFESVDIASPAKFVLLSAPAHQTFETTLVRISDIRPMTVGANETANHRKIHQCIVADRVKTNQLVMGFTELQSGSVWNTMPPHTHSRRSEIYFYFDIAPGNVVCHYCGEPTQTRHVWVHNEQAALSPWWSIHAGCGTASYKFVWAMAGENVKYDDMDKVAATELR